jgi:hypothetical protein
VRLFRSGFRSTTVTYRLGVLIWQDNALTNVTCHVAAGLPMLVVELILLCAGRAGRQ